MIGNIGMKLKKKSKSYERTQFNGIRKGVNF
jgi:hypothetical protein